MIMSYGGVLVDDKSSKNINPAKIQIWQKYKSGSKLKLLVYDFCVLKTASLLGGDPSPATAQIRRSFRSASACRSKYPYRYQNNINPEKHKSGKQHKSGKKHKFGKSTNPAFIPIGKRLPIEIYLPEKHKSGKSINPDYAVTGFMCVPNLCFGPAVSSASSLLSGF